MTVNLDVMRARHAHCGPAICDTLTCCEEIESVREENQRTGMENQRWVDEVIYYRNLAIDNGAPPDSMLNNGDRTLCEKWATLPTWPGDFTFADERAATRELWEDNERLEAEVERLRTIVAALIEEEAAGSESGPVPLSPEPTTESVECGDNEMLPAAVRTPGEPADPTQEDRHAGE